MPNIVSLAQGVLIYFVRDVVHNKLRKLSKLEPEVIKSFSLLNSAEHEILNAHKCKNIKKFSLFRLR